MSGWAIHHIPRNDLTPVARAMGHGPVPAHLYVSGEFSDEGPALESPAEVEQFIADLRTEAAKMWAEEEL